MRVTISGLLQAAAVVTAVLSFLTLLPIDHFSVQLFTHFRLQYFGMSVLLLLVFLGVRNPTFIGLMVVTLAVNSTGVLPWYTGNDEPRDGSGLKLIHANVLSSNTDHERLIRHLESEAPDIVVLQEVSANWLVALDALRLSYPYSYAEAREGNFGIALFSRLPIKSATHIDSAPLGYPTIIAAVEVGDDVLQVIATHPMIPVSSGFYKARNEQLADIAELLAERPGPKVLVGDLNLSQWDINHSRLEQQAGVKNARRGFGIVPTWPTFMPFAMIPIDHVLVSKSITVTGLHSGPRIGSDHLPLVVTMKL